MHARTDARTHTLTNPLCIHTHTHPRRPLAREKLHARADPDEGGELRRGDAEGLPIAGADREAGVVPGDGRGAEDLRAADARGRVGRGGWLTLTPPLCHAALGCARVTAAHAHRALS